MEKEIIIKYKLIENIILEKDEKGKDKIIYLNEKIPDDYSFAKFLRILTKRGIIKNE